MRALLNNLGAFYATISKPEKALVQYEQALNIMERLGEQESLHYARCLNNMSVAYRAAKNLDKAQAVLRKGNDILSKILGEKNPTCSIGLEGLANLFLEKGLVDSALHYCRLSINANIRQDLQGKMPDLKRLESYDYLSDEQMLSSLSVLYNCIEQTEIASEDSWPETLKESLSILQSMVRANDKIRCALGNDQSRLRLFEYNAVFSEKILELLTELRRREPTSSDWNEQIFYCMEQNKAVLLTEATKSQRAKSLFQLPDSLEERERDILQRYDELKRKMLDSKQQDEKLLISQAMNQVTLEAELFKKQLKQISPQYHKYKYDNTLSSASEFCASLDEKTALLEYFVSDSVVYLLCLTRKAIDLYSLPVSRRQLSERVADLRKVLSDYEFIQEQADEAHRLYCKSAYGFYRDLLQPALQGKTLDALILVPDGELGHLPFEAFLTEAVSDSNGGYARLPYLLRRYKISYNYSATLLQENRQRGARRSNGKLLALAPDYSYQDEDQEKTKLLRGPRLENLRSSLSDLPAAKNEVQMLASLFEGEFWQGKQAVERQFKNQSANYAILHLAMHGLLNKKDPIASSLCFTEDGDSTEDNFLEAWEISHLNLNADMVVLSACETGYGKFLQGEGVLSLARSFMYAGVPALVVSLWEVNDVSTSQFMQFFYENLSKGMDKAQALQQAKLTYLDDAKGYAAHPAYWSPFIQIGDDAPIQLSKKSLSSIYLYAGLAMALVLALWAAVRMKSRKEA